MWLSAWGNTTVTAKGTEWGMQEWQRGKGRMREGKRRRGEWDEDIRFVREGVRVTSVRDGKSVAKRGVHTWVGARKSECVCVHAWKGGRGVQLTDNLFLPLAWTKDVIGSSVLGQIFFMWVTKKADSQLSNNNNNGMSQCFQWIGQTGGPVLFYGSWHMQIMIRSDFSIL